MIRKNFYFYLQIRFSISIYNLKDYKNLFWNLYSEKKLDLDNEYVLTKLHNK